MKLCAWVAKVISLICIIYYIESINDMQDDVLKLIV